MSYQMFDFYAYYLSMSHDKRKKFAKRAGTSDGYIYTHLIRKTRMPQKDLITRLVKAGKGDFSKGDLLGFFYG